MEIYYTKNELKSVDFLKTVLDYKGISVDLTNIEISAHGKPFIKDLEFDFNLSHTKNMTACVIGKNVGIDCQEIKSVRTVVIERVCSENDIQKINKAQDKELEFARLWSFKEAYTKMIGSGFRYSFKNTNIENAFCLHPYIKIYQKLIDNTILTAVEENSQVAKITQI